MKGLNEADMNVRIPTKYKQAQTGTPNFEIGEGMQTSNAAKAYYMSRPYFFDGPPESEAPSITEDAAMSIHRAMRQFLPASVREKLVCTRTSLQPHMS